MPERIEFTVHATSRAVNARPSWKLHAIAQMKDQRQRLRLLPTLGQRGREMKAGIAGHQSIEEQLVDVLRLRIGADARIKVGRAALDQKDHRPRVARSRVAARQRYQRGQDHQKVWVPQVSILRPGKQQALVALRIRHLPQDRRPTRAGRSRAHFPADDARSAKPAAQRPPPPWPRRAGRTPRWPPVRNPAAPALRRALPSVSHCAHRRRRRCSPRRGLA